jgi:hypothetical protein
MTEVIDSTPEGGNAPTPEQKPADKKLEFTQEEFDKVIKDRLDRAEKAAAKQFQKKIDELTSKIQDFEGKDLGELEKLQKKLEKLTGEVAEKDKALSGATLKLSKMEALLTAGALPEQIPKLLKRVSGTTPEEIESDVSELKEMGWIGGPKPEPKPEPKNQGTGTQVTDGAGSGKKTVQAQLDEVNAKLRDPKLPYSEKSKLIDLSIQLNRKLQRGET